MQAGCEVEKGNIARRYQRENPEPPISVSQAEVQFEGGHRGKAKKGREGKKSQAKGYGRRGGRGGGGSRRMMSE